MKREIQAVSVLFSSLLLVMACANSPVPLPELPKELEAVDQMRKVACDMAAIPAWQARDSRLADIHELCVQGAELEAIAARFAGCISE